MIYESSTYIIWIRHMRIAKWGNSLAVRIPRDVAEALGLEEGDDVELRAGDDGTLRVNRVATREEALRRMRAYRGRLPADYRFDRDEANAR
jgi:antitoxin MazE